MLAIAIYMILFGFFACAVAGRFVIPKHYAFGRFVFVAGATLILSGLIALTVANHL
jgi:hypothetical protein